MKLVSVVLDIPTQALDSTFTYVAIENENDRIRFSKLVAQDLAQNQKKPKDEIDPKRHQAILSSNQLKFLLMIYLVLSHQRHCLMARPMTVLLTTTCVMTVRLTLYRERIQLLKTLSIQRGESLFWIQRA